MNYEDALEHIFNKKARIQDELNVLDKLYSARLMDDIIYINDGNIYFKNDVDMDYIRRIVNIALGCNMDKLTTYYVSGTGTLCVRYDNDKISMYFYNTDIEGTLAKVSGGKCRVETVTETITELRVVCEERKN